MVPETRNARPWSAAGIEISSCSGFGFCGASTGSSRVETSEIRGEGLAGREDLELERGLLVGGAVVGLVTLLECVPKARVFWAWAVGAEDLRRVGGMIERENV